MNATDFANELELLTRAKLPVLVKGSPGQGKTDIYHQVSRRLNMDMITTHPVTSDPTDPKGLGVFYKGDDGAMIADFIPYGHLRMAMSVTKPTFWFFDDLGQAAPMVLAAYMQLFLGREVNGKRVSDHIIFGAATNRRIDLAAVQGIPEPVKQRFATIILLETTAEEWCFWAVDNDIAPEVIAFIRWRPELLNEGEASTKIENHASPRMWHFVSKMVLAGITNVETFAGAVGMGVASEFDNFRGIYKNLPDIGNILTNPDSALVPNETSASYAVVSALSNRYANTKLNKDEVNNIVRYALRMDKIFGSYLVRDCHRRDKKICNVPSYPDWASQNKDIILTAA